MNERYRTFQVKSYSSGTFGRAISNVRNHHFVTDDVGGDEVGPAEFFFSGISACAVNMVEKIARQAPSDATVPSSSCCIRREYPATSAIRMAASLRETPSDSVMAFPDPS